MSSKAGIGKKPPLQARTGGLNSFRGLPQGRIVVYFLGLSYRSLNMNPKRNYYGALGQGLRLGSRKVFALSGFKVCSGFRRALRAAPQAA